MRSSTYLSVLLSVAVSASPAEKLPDTLFCTINKVIISLLSKEAAATTYCSSFLSIPTSTISTTVTVTPSSGTTTYVTKDVTRTSTVVKTEYTTTVSISTSTVTCLNGAYTPAPSVAVVPAPSIEALQKRSTSIHKPTALPTEWPENYISSACSCLSLPTPSVTRTATQTLAPVITTQTLTKPIVTTITTTTTQTITAAGTATTLVPNGVQYRQYRHPFDIDQEPEFNSTFFNGNGQVEFSGAMTSLTFATDNWPSGGDYTLRLPDRPQGFWSEYTALLVQGFFIAREKGRYQFVSLESEIDNWGYLWVGDAAYSAWSDANTSFKSRRSAASISGNHSVVLSAGEAIPLTYLWANGRIAAQSIFRVDTPYAANITDHTGLFIQACSPKVFP